MTKREVLQRQIAAVLDNPSIYVGGPSHVNMRRSERIIQLIEEECGFAVDLTEPYVLPPVPPPAA